MQPFVSIIIPHWNGREHLADCLNALRQQTVSEFEVLLVDNGSDDGSQAYVQEQFHEVTLIELGTNRGFTGACLAGYARAKGDIIILLNNDTAVEPDWLAEILAAFERHPQAGSVASRMMLFDERDHFHTAGDFVRINGIPGNRGVWEQDAGQYDQEMAVFGACGGSSAYRKTMLDEIGFLDPTFFFSCEDVDLAWRAQLAGWKTIYAPKAKLYHKLKATGGSATGSFYDGRNFLWLIAKNYPTSLLLRNWQPILQGQWQITRDALRHWRGEAARARLKGQLFGLLGLGKMLIKRRQIQANRRVSDDYLLSLLWPVDDP